MKNKFDALEEQFNYLLKITDSKQLILLLSTIERKELVTLLEHSSRLTKAKFLIEFEEGLAKENKQIVSYEFSDLKERLTFLKELQERIYGLMEVIKMSRIYPAVLNEAQVKRLLMDLCFEYTMENGKDPEILNFIKDNPTLDAD